LCEQENFPDKELEKDAEVKDKEVNFVNSNTFCIGHRDLVKIYYTYGDISVTMDMMMFVIYFLGECMIFR